MPDEAGELLRKAEEMLTDAKHGLRREMEAPIARLTPEAREDAIKVAKEIWVESMRLLGGKDENVRRDSNGDALILESKKKLDNTIFEGADLGINRYHYEYENNVTYYKHELYTFYPDHVLKTTRNSSRHNEGKKLAPRGLATEKHEANRDELRELLEVVKNSTQFKSNRDTF